MLANLDELSKPKAKRKWDKFLTEMGYSGGDAGAVQVVQKQRKSDDAPPAAPTRSLTDEEKLAQVSKTFEERDYLEYQELKGKAVARQASNLNLSGA